MNNYLLQLLKEVKTIIIPGLGAMTLTNEATGEMMFMPYLKFDDGTLAKHISEKEGMELNDAKNLIAKFVREVTAELDKGNSYDMYRFGKFLKEDGEVAFVQWNEQQATSEPEPQKPVQPEPIVVPEPTPEPEPIPEPIKPIVTPEIVPEKETPTVIPEPETPIKTPEPEIPEVKPENPPFTPEFKEKVEETPPPTTQTGIPDAAAKAAIEEEFKRAISGNTPTPEKTAKPTSPEKPKSTVKPPVKEEKNVVRKDKPVKSTPLPEAKKKRKVLPYVLWGIVVLILGGATYVAVNFDTLKSDFPILADLAGANDTTAKGDDDVTTTVEDDSLTANEPLPGTMEGEPTQEPEPVEETPVETVSKPEPEVVSEPVKTPSKPKHTKPSRPSGGTGSVSAPDPSRPYHIIAGSFGSEVNANRLAQQLAAKGKSPSVIAYGSGKYRVSINSYSSNAEALRDLPAEKSDFPNAWVVKWP